MAITEAKNSPGGWGRINYRNPWELSTVSIKMSKAYGSGTVKISLSSLLACVSKTGKSYLFRQIIETGADTGMSVMLCIPKSSLDRYMDDLIKAIPVFILPPREQAHPYAHEGACTGCPFWNIAGPRFCNLIGDERCPRQNIRAGLEMAF